MFASNLATGIDHLANMSETTDLLAVVVYDDRPAGEA